VTCKHWDSNPTAQDYEVCFARQHNVNINVLLHQFLVANRRINTNICVCACVDQSIHVRCSELTVVLF
jgi:hypothetical protein